MVVGGGGWWCIGQRPGQVSFISLTVRGSMKLKLELANIMAEKLYNYISKRVMSCERRSGIGSLNHCV